MLYEATLLEELAFSEKVIRAGHEVVPRFRVFSHEGEFCVLVPLPGEADSRAQALRQVATFMAMKLASGFILACELVEPDALMALAVSRKGAEGYVMPIIREPLSFGAREQVDGTSAGSEILELLPAKETSIGALQLRELEEAMESGKFMQVTQIS
jgi:hypothetical protein